MKGRNKTKHFKKPKKKTDQEFKDEVRALVGDEFVVNEPYKNSKTKLQFTHSCGRSFYSSPHNFLSNKQSCPYCSREKGMEKQRSNDKEYKKRVYDLVQDEYTVIGTYINSRTKIDVRHETCGLTFKVKPDAFIRGNQTRCPNCSRKQSKGEKKVEEYLIQNHIPYQKEQTCDDLRSKKNWKLRFDFAIYDEEQIESVVEVDGIGHFKSVEYFRGEEGLKQVEENDEIKNQYCKKKGIQLIRIPYTIIDDTELILHSLLSHKIHT
ncbi:hypothetical protein [Tetragenococcus halophilus]|uniref:hypothetical protein n=1 Tax=Tetragenococcus halophilus TaxID=51669 RepID=UPI00301021BD